jgi:hypothetical protein
MRISTPFLVEFQLLPAAFYVRASTLSILYLRRQPGETAGQTCV